MLLIRLVLLLAIGVSLALFALSNLQPLSLTFLGISTPALPLSLWILGAIAAGIITNLLINALFSLSNYLTAREVRTQLRQAPRRGTFRTQTASTSTQAATDPSDDDADWQDWEGYEEPVDRSRADGPSVKQAAADDTDDDWDSGLDDDWERYESEEPRQSAREATEDEEPVRKSSRRSSTYSYGYRDPGNTGVGKEEPIVSKPVVDAEFRVIVPPYYPPDSFQPSEQYSSTADAEEESADDWFEDDDDEFKEDDRRSRR